MERPTEIVKRYEQGDSDEKLCLFTQFRELRDVFDDIEFKNQVAENNHNTTDEIEGMSKGIQDRSNVLHAFKANLKQLISTKRRR